MAVYKPSNLSPDLGEIDLLEDNDFSCQVNTSGTYVKAYKLSIFAQSNNEEVYAPAGVNLGTSQVKNKGILSFTFSAANAAAAGMLNGNDYKWKVRVYEDALGATTQPLTKICEGYLTGTTKYVIWTKDNDVLERDRWIEFTDKTSADMFPILPPNTDNKELPASGETYTERHQIDWLSDELGTYSDISKIECDKDFKYNYIDGTTFSIFQVSSEHGWNNFFADPNDEIKEGTSYISLWGFNLNTYSTYAKVNLLTVGTSPPSIAHNGNKYYNTGMTMVYTYDEANSSWLTGSTPSVNILYTAIDTGLKYYYDGSTWTAITPVLKEIQRKVTGYNVETGEVRVAEAFTQIPEDGWFYKLFTYDSGQGISWTSTNTYLYATITAVTFINKVNSAYGSYVFTYNPTSYPTNSWGIDGVDTPLSDYGIAVNTPSALVEGDTLTVTYVNAYTQVTFSVSNLVGGAPIQSTDLTVMTNKWDASTKRLFIQPNINVKSDPTNPCEITFDDGVRVDITKNTDSSLPSNTDTTFNTLDNSMWIVTNPTLAAGTMSMADITPKRPYIIYGDFMDSLPSALIYARTSATLTLQYKAMDNEDTTYATVVATPPVSYRDITFRTLWNSPEFVQIKYYKYFLYDSGGTLIAESGATYDSDCTWSFRGLQSGPLNSGGQTTPYRYFISVNIVDAYGRTYTVEKSPFRIEYETNAANVDMSVEFNCDTYSIDVGIDASLFAESVASGTKATVVSSNVTYNTDQYIYELDIPANKVLNYQQVAGADPVQPLFFPPTFDFVTDFQLTAAFIESIPSTVASGVTAPQEMTVLEVGHWNGTSIDVFKMTCTSFDEYIYQVDANNNIILTQMNNEQFRLKLYKNDILCSTIWDGNAYYDLVAADIGLSKPVTYGFALQNNANNIYQFVSSLNISQPSPSYVYVLRDDTDTYTLGLYKYNTTTETFYRLTGYTFIYADNVSDLDATLQTTIFQRSATPPVGGVPDNAYDSNTGDFLWTETNNVWVESGDLVAYFGEVLGEKWITFQLSSQSTPSTVATIVTGDYLTAITVTTTIFEKKVEFVTGTYTFEYDGSSWELNSTVINIADYGISITGAATAFDTFTVAYSLTFVDSCNIDIGTEAK